MGLGSLMGEELRALPRGRFTLLGCALLLAYAAFLGATMGTLPYGDRYFLLPVVGLAPLLLVPVAAMQLARARASRFVEGVFTAPVTMGRFLLAKVLATLLAGFAYLALVLPLLLVKWAHLGIAEEDVRFLLLGLGVTAYAVLLGTLLGVLFTSRGSLAPLATAIVAAVGGAAAVLALGSVPLPTEEPTRTLVLHGLHLSGALLLQDALGLGSPAVSLEPTASALGFVVLCAGLALLAWWVFTREQSPEGWEARGPRAAGVAVAVALVLVVPAALAGTQYGRAGDGDEGRTEYSAGGVWVRVVPRGADVPPAKTTGNHPPELIETGRASEVDLLVFLHEAQGEVRNVAVRVTGEGLAVDPGLHEVASPGPLPVGRSLTRFEEAPYLRIPAVLTPAPPTSLRGNEHALLVNVTFEDERGGPATAAGEFKVESAVPGAPLQVAAAGAVAPIVLLGAFAARRWRMR